MVKPSQLQNIMLYMGFHGLNLLYVNGFLAGPKGILCEGWLEKRAFSKRGRII